MKDVRMLVIKENRLRQGKEKNAQEDNVESREGEKGNEGARPKMEAGVEEELYLSRKKE